MKRVWAYALCAALGLAGLIVTDVGVPVRVCAQDGAESKPKRSRSHLRAARHAKRDKLARTQPRTGEAQAVSAEMPADGQRDKKKKRRNARAKAGTASEQSAAAGPPGSKPAVARAREEKVESGPSAAAQAAQAAASGVNAQIVKEGDTSVKMMEFTGLGIEGRLKSPQLVYFVQRVRAEFERPVLPHRSFMPELEASSQTRGREPLR